MATLNILFIFAARGVKRFVQPHVEQSDAEPFEDLQNNY